MPLSYKASARDPDSPTLPKSRSRFRCLMVLPLSLSLLSTTIYNKGLGHLDDPSDPSDQEYTNKISLFSHHLQAYDCHVFLEVEWTSRKSEQSSEDDCSQSAIGFDRRPRLILRTTVWSFFCKWRCNGPYFSSFLHHAPKTIKQTARDRIDMLHFHYDLMVICWGK